MASFRFIHLADCHLDAPYTTKNLKIRKMLLDAAYTSFENAVTIALGERVHAFLIAGDLFDQNYLSFRGERMLMEQLSRLVDAGITVIYATGNHDHGGEGSKAQSLSWPDIEIIDGAFRLVEVHEAGELVGVVGGIGHASRRTGDNLATKFPRLSYDVPTVGLLHCQVAASLSPEEPYAPCTTGDLQDKGYDYWALGHIHKPQQVLEHPLAHYCGSLIGNNPKEDGPRGVLLVELSRGSGHVEFRPTAPLEWLRLAPDLANVSSFAELLGVLENSAPERSTDVLVRIEFSGPSPLSQEIHRMAADERQWEELAAQITQTMGVLAVELKLGTLSGPKDPAEYKNAPHMLGEALAVHQELVANPAEVSKLVPTLAGVREGFIDEQQLGDYLKALLRNLEQELTLRMVKE